MIGTVKKFVGTCPMPGGFHSLSSSKSLGVFRRIYPSNLTPQPFRENHGETIPKGTNLKPRDVFNTFFQRKEELDASR
jgi:hypothetical protein